MVRPWHAGKTVLRASSYCLCVGMLTATFSSMPSTLSNLTVRIGSLPQFDRARLGQAFVAFILFGKVAVLAALSGPVESGLRVRTSPVGNLERPEFRPRALGF